VAAMIAAAAGYIPPPIGALLQEAIDVAVILNALRTSRQPRESIPPPASTLSQKELELRSLEQASPVPKARHAS
jgi:hypothetical protein